MCVNESDVGGRVAWLGRMGGWVEKSAGRVRLRSAPLGSVKAFATNDVMSHLASRNLLLLICHAMLIVWKTFVKQLWLMREIGFIFLLSECSC